MKAFPLAGGVLALVLSPPVCAADPAPAAVSLTITVRNISDAGGDLRIGVYDAANFATKDGVPTVRKVTHARGPKMTITFDGIVSWGPFLGELRDVTTPRVVAREDAFELSLEPGPPGELVASTGMPGPQVHKLLSTIGTGTLTRLRIARPREKAQRQLLEKHAKRIGFELEYF